jgi:hypothetical protein
MDLDRLRELAREPERTAMGKGTASMTDQVFKLKQENAALRRGLNEAIGELERFLPPGRDGVEKRDSGK